MQTNQYVPTRLDIGQWDVETLRRYLGLSGDALDLLTAWEKNPVEFFAQSIKALRARMSANRVADFTRSLVFLAGNLDEAFAASEIADPNAVLPDDLFETTTKVTLNDLKQALLARFRPEQVARLGSTHILFPGFNREQYREIIDRRLSLLAERTAQTLDLQLRFDDSVRSLLFDEAVVPTQGARPVVSLISEFIESQIPSWLTGVRLADLEKAALTIRYDSASKTLCAEGVSKRGLPADLFKSHPAISQTVIRIKRSDPVLRHIVAVHEAGHAVAGIVSLGMLPKQVRSPALHGATGGHVDFGEVPIARFQLGLAQLICDLGGFTAEEIVFGKEARTAGSIDDLRKATALTAQLVTQLGMGPHVGQSSMDPAFPDALTSLKKKDDRLKEAWLRAAAKGARKAIETQSELFDALVAFLLKEAKSPPEDLKRLFATHYKGPAAEKKAIAARTRPAAYEAYIHSVERRLRKSSSRRPRARR
jgi:cell division protease FtsH